MVKTKERRCINPACKRLLVDEKTICSRCKRMGWKKIKKGGEIGTAIVIALGGIAAVANNLSNSDDDSKQG